LKSPFQITSQARTQSSELPGEPAGRGTGIGNFLRLYFFGILLVALTIAGAIVAFFIGTAIALVLSAVLAVAAVAVILKISFRRAR
jgi:hypothetical protein